MRKNERQRKPEAPEQEHSESQISQIQINSARESRKQTPKHKKWKAN